MVVYGFSSNFYDNCQKIAYIYKKGYRDFLAHFQRFDKLSHNLSLPGLNSVLKLIFLLQMQIQCCICKTHHFLLSLIRAISVKKMKMTYSNRAHYWIISQIQIKLLSSEEKVEHSFRFILPSNFSFFLFFLMKWIAPSKGQGIHVSRAEEGSRCTKKVAQREKIDCVATYLISCLPMILFGFAIPCLKE